jgi:hypothetical protein
MLHGSRRHPRVACLQTLGRFRPLRLPVEHRGKFLRVQVKSTIARFCDGYVCSLKSSRGQHYTRQQVDFFAVYVIPEDVWYILPAKVATPLKGHFMLAPQRKGQKYEPYMEAWHLLRGQDAGPEPASPSISSATPNPALDSPPPPTAISGAPGPDVTARKPAFASPFDPDGVVVKRMQQCAERLLSRSPFKR